MSREWVDDAHVCRLRRRLRKRCAVHGIVLDLFECRCEVVRVAADLCATLIRAVLARARDRHLDERRRNRGDDRRCDHSDDAAAVVVARASCAEDRRKLGNVCRIRDDGRHRRGDGRNEDVTMLDVRQLMPEHARDLVVVEDAHQPRRNGDSRMGRIAPRRECVRRVLVDDVDARHRESRIPREFLDQAVELRCTRTVDLLCIIHAQHHAVGEPVREEVHTNRDDEHDGHACMSAEYAAKGDHQRHQECHEHCCFQCVHSFISPLSVKSLSF